MLLNMHIYLYLFFLNEIFYSLTILVNRGWIPSLYNNEVKNHKNQTEDEVEIVGILRVNEKRPPFVPDNAPEKSMWYYR